MTTHNNNTSVVTAKRDSQQPSWVKEERQDGHREDDADKQPPLREQPHLGKRARSKGRRRECALRRRSPERRGSGKGVKDRDGHRGAAHQGRVGEATQRQHHGRQGHSDLCKERSTARCCEAEQSSSFSAGSWRYMDGG